MKIQLQTKKEAARLLTILNRVGNSIWGLESRILAITTHSLPESLAGCGLAVTGTHITKGEIDMIDASTLKKAERRLDGTGATARREVLHALVDTNSMENKMLDRALRATGSTAQKTAKTFLRNRYHL